MDCFLAPSAVSAQGSNPHSASLTVGSAEEAMKRLNQAQQAWLSGCRRLDSSTSFFGCQFLQWDAPLFNSELQSSQIMGPSWMAYGHATQH